MRLCLGIIFFLLTCFVHGQNQKTRSDNYLNKNYALYSRYLKESKYHKALHYAKKIYSYLQKTYGEKHDHTYTAKGNLALVYLLLSEYDKAQPLILETLEYRKRNLGKEHPYTLVSMNNLAELYLNQGRYKKGESVCLEVFELRKKVLGETHADTLISMSNLAAFYRKQKKTQQAKALLLRNLKLRQKALGENHPHTFVSMNNLVELYSWLGQYEKAEPLILKTVEYRKKILGKKHFETIVSMINLASIYTGLKKYDKAESLLIEILQLLEQKVGKNYPEYMLALHNLGAFYARLQQYDQAQKILSDWFEKRNQYLEQILVTNRATQQSYLEEFRHSLDILLTLYLRNNTPEIARKFVEYSLARKGILLRFSPDTITPSQRLDPQVREKFLQLQKLRSSLTSLLLSPPQKVSQGHQKSIAQLQNTIEKKEAELAQINKDFRRFTREVSQEFVCRKMVKNEVAVDFLVVATVDLQHQNFKHKSKKLVATVMSKNNIHLVELGEYTELEEQMRQYRAAISRCAPLHEVNNLGFEVYKKIWLPLQKYVTGYAKIYVVPDGILHLLPFQALVDHDGRYLLETNNIHLISSLHHLAYDANDYDSSYGKSVLFTHPHYGNTKEQSAQRNSKQHLHFKPLPGTAKEGKVLKSMFAKNQLPVEYFFDKKASKQQIQTIESPKVLHIATHGFFIEKLSTASEKERGIFVTEKPSRKDLPQNNIHPLAQCGLAFSDANIHQQQGILTAMEVLSLDLSATELVVLSACDTSLGKIVSGEGVYSLRRSFQEAGAKTVLSTLWSASDEGTVYLMKEFYRHYLNKTSPQFALCNAQLQCIASKKYHHPYYWANFVMVGVDRHFTGYHSKRKSFAQRSSALIWTIFVLRIIIVVICVILFIDYKRKVR